MIAMSLLQLLLDIVFYPPIFQVLVVGLIVSLIIVVITIWFERKAAARVQRRLGPYHVSPQLGGLLQPLADLVRYAFQEPIIPRTVDAAIFVVAPVVAAVLSIIPLGAVPFTSNPAYWPIPMENSLLIALALSTVAPLFIVLTGWASNNKFAVIGGVREAFMITAYELIAIVAMLAPAATLSTFNMVDIVEAQASLTWFILLNPLAFIAAFLAVVMSTSGFPYEIPESENEVVAGPYSEYSGILYGVNMGANYLRRFALSILIAILFLGGWLPVQPGDGLVAGYLIPTIVVLAKALIVMLVASFLRAVYARFRLDQALEGAWKYVFPLALIGLGLGIIENLLL